MAPPYDNVILWYPSFSSDTFDQDSQVVNHTTFKSHFLFCIHTSLPWISEKSFTQRVGAEGCVCCGHEKLDFYPRFDFSNFDIWYESALKYYHKQISSMKYLVWLSSIHINRTFVSIQLFILTKTWVFKQFKPGRRISDQKNNNVMKREIPREHVKLKITGALYLISRQIFTLKFSGKHKFSADSHF